MSAPNEVPDLYQLAFMPGCFRCPKCDFRLTKSAISASTGQIGTREEDRQSEPCPNDGTFMVHVTYREQLEEYADRLRQEIADNTQLRAVAGAARDVVCDAPCLCYQHEVCAGCRLRAALAACPETTHA